MKKNTAEKQTDFRVLFILGITFTGAGVAMGFPPMMALGLIFMVIGLFNRDKWPQDNLH